MLILQAYDVMIRNGIRRTYLQYMSQKIPPPPLRLSDFFHFFTNG